MTASFGLDHPLVATHDIGELRGHLIAMGFNMTPIGRHPWGTSTSLAMFRGCLLEIMGIYDETLIDEVPAGDFRFGRHVFDHLREREGVALTALHSTDSQADADTAALAGFEVAGHLAFSREVTLPDGRTDHTKTTLALLPDAQFPRLSFFLCQQHRPELIYVPEWLEHPNTAQGLAGVNVIAREDQFPALIRRFSGIYPMQSSAEAYVEFPTANGVLRLLNLETFEESIGPVAAAVRESQPPFIAGMDFSVGELRHLTAWFERAGIPFFENDVGIVLEDPQATANTTFRFLPTQL